ncbi:melatonin-related receptor [Grus japonensis]|uniref:Melatonin-related receptor n=1 Tax=Grus japonensis TaxID=30415 RepID=A0ABC9XDK6_GRUJA
MERLGSNGSCPGCRLEGGPSARAATALAAVLIFTIVVDVLGNALVILSVLRNKKLRNAGATLVGLGLVLSEFQAQLSWALELLGNECVTAVDPGPA